MRPLEGVLVVSCEHAVAAPLATRHLADLGARVIKVERPGSGDFARAYDETVKGLSSHFVWLNRSKESIVLDLKDPADALTMRRLLARADVFVQNLAPGAAERLGFGPRELRRSLPRLITCSVSGYGSGGPDAGKKAYDLLIQSEVGLISITGTPEQPAKAGIPVADISAGMYAFSSILAALYSRERTNLGADIEVSLFDSLIEWMSYPLYYTRYGTVPPPRTGTSHAAIAPYGIVRCGDGSELVVAVQNEREWTVFCREVLHLPALLADRRFETVPSRSRNREVLGRAIDKALGSMSGPALEASLTRAGIAFARRMEIPQVLDHLHAATPDRWVDVGSPVGPVNVMRPAGLARDWVPRMDNIPAVGEHTEQILSWLDQARPLASGDGRLADPAGATREAAAATRIEQGTSAGI